MIFDIAAPIIPGREAAGIRLGSPLHGDLAHEAVRLFGSSGLVKQIAVRAGYLGHIAGTPLGIGSTIREIEHIMGPVVEDEKDNLVVQGSDGWCFETERWTGQDIKANAGARVVSICVFVESA